MVASRDPELEAPGPDELYDVGVAGVVARMLKVPDGTLRILVQGGQRVRIDELDRRPSPTSSRASTELPDVVEAGAGAEALMRNVQHDVHAASSRRSPTCPRSCRSRSPTSRTRGALAT